MLDLVRYEEDWVLSYRPGSPYWTKKQ